MSDSIFSKSVKAGGKMYFFDVKKSQNGKQSQYLQVTESRLKDGQPVRSRLTIFSDQLQAFAQAFSEASAKVN
jgi:hypothetical protein